MLFLDKDAVSLPAGAGSVRAWYQTVECLEDWEKNLNLGDAFIKTSAKSECARAKFTLGLLCLHNFQYDLAMEFFEAAESEEQSSSGRSYPMAMWGAAMATTQILWQSSNCKKGKEYLEKIPKEHKWIFPQEQAFIETGFALYPKHLKCDKDNVAREKRFMKAMGQVLEKYPKETEPNLFYGVSKAAVSGHTGMSDSEKNKQMKDARSTLENLYKKHPTHSGLIHYLNHMFDTPELYLKGNEKFLNSQVNPTDQKGHAAALGIKAATEYLQVAPSSCHGLHMPSHIFMRLGDWEMSLRSNLLSIKVNYDMIIINH